MTLDILILRGTNMTVADKRYYYDELGDRFEEYMSDYDVERRRRLVFDVLLTPDMVEGRRVLEVGSGTGRFSKVLSSMTRDLTIVDIGEGLVRDVAGSLPCAGVTGDACELPFTDNSFELVVSSECIEHTPSPVRAIEEMCRVCTPSGRVCFTTPNRLWYPVMRLSQLTGLRRFDGDENWISARRAAGTMRGRGMTDIRVSGCHLWPFQIKPTRPLLRRIDRFGGSLHPIMINFGVVGRKRD